MAWYLMICLSSVTSGFWPKWVRFCTFKAGDQSLPAGLTDPAHKPTSSSNFGEITSSHYVPMLHPRVIDEIDSILRRETGMFQMVEVNRTQGPGCGGSEQGLRKEVEADVSRPSSATSQKLEYKGSSLSKIEALAQKHGFLLGGGNDDDKGDSPLVQAMKASLMVWPLQGNAVLLPRLPAQ
ncbi:hypothetical protein DUNSADRAFT_12473 [Dunaliella salina]|uniref:Encoded protein n=1 Tax=Dunaliella salina TaxID=3046 RepID=A0ABQ7H3V4_DUNSA|nr:hypothetical protein DUNSADRAFT_12473 [Dunaliella salina]|eukprot:KAF5841545.1 hypothetical protein DUNSADRAFT_12473 [Dunaliella salina]